MSPLLLETFNRFTGRQDSIAGAIAHVYTLDIRSLPEEYSPSDWRSYVPLQLLVRWEELTDDERVTIFVMALSATHSFDGSGG